MACYLSPCWNPVGNRNIVLTIQPEKPLKGELNFFPETQGSRSLPFVLSTDAARQKPFHIPAPRHDSRLECCAMGSVSIASMMRRRRLADCSAWLRSAIESDAMSGVVSHCRAQVVLSCKLDGKFMESDFVSRQGTAVSLRGRRGMLRRCVPTLRRSSPSGGFRGSIDPRRC